MPTVVLPPVAPFTCQVTLVLPEFATVAENALLDPIATLADVGTTDTATAGGATLLLLPPPPQAAIITDSSNAPRLR